MFPGYASRLEKEVKKLYIDTNLKESKEKKIKLDITIIDSPRRKFSVFIGATVLAKIYNEQEAYWISRADWDECGPDIIFKKCQNILQ